MPLKTKTIVAMHKLFFILMLLILAGCQSQQEPSKDFSKFIFQKPSANKGLIYIYRRRYMPGCAIEFSVMLKDKVVGVAKSGSYFTHELEPGKHELWVRTDITGQTTCPITIEAGKTYFIEGSMQMGLLVGRGTLTTVEESVGREYIPQLKEISSTDNKITTPNKE